MPAFSQSPFGPAPALLVPGTSGYSFGTFSDQTPTTKMFVTNVAIASNVVTLTVQIWEGPVPTTHQLISTQGLSNIPNVTNVAIASVSAFSDLTNGTITYALTHADVTSVADAGLALAPAAEVGDTITPTQAVKGAAFSLSALDKTNSRSIAWSVSFPATPPSASFEADLEGAIENIDSQYFKLDKITAVGGGTQVVSPVAQINFVRVHVVTNDAATSIVAKVSI